MNKMSFFRRSGAQALALSLILVPALATAQTPRREVERGLEPKHQPVVSRTDFVFDVTGDDAGRLSAAERNRLTVWFDALGLGYGDHVSLAGANRGTLALQDSLTEVVGRYGLLIDGEAPATAGESPAGGIRVVVSRSVASVPGCPSWRDKSEANYIGGLSDNYGCATNSNLAAMIADPRDLVEGRTSGLDVTSGISSKAVTTLRNKAQTGAAGLGAN